MRVIFQVTYGIVRTLAATRVTDRDAELDDLYDKEVTYHWAMYRGQVLGPATDHQLIAVGEVLHRYGDGPIVLTQKILQAYDETPEGKADRVRRKKAD